LVVENDWMRKQTEWLNETQRRAAAAGRAVDGQSAARPIESAGVAGVVQFGSAVTIVPVLHFTNYRSACVM
jgi:hypothetical protein